MPEACIPQPMRIAQLPGSGTQNEQIRWRSECSLDADDRASHLTRHPERPASACILHVPDIETGGWIDQTGGILGFQSIDKHHAEQFNAQQVDPKPVDPREEGCVLDVEPGVR